MEGIFFYWILWTAWVYCTFILEKTEKRTYMTAGLLLFIILAPRHIYIGDFMINSTLFFSVLIGYYLLSKKRKTLLSYYLFVSLITTISFVTFRLFQIYDPVWVMFHPTLKLSVIIALLILMLVREQEIRLSLIFITVAQGELIYTLFLSKIVPQFLIGELKSLDIIAISGMFTFFWFTFEKIVSVLDDFIKQKTVLKTPQKDN